MRCVAALSRLSIRCAILLCVLAPLPLTADAAPAPTAPADWSSYAYGVGGARFSPLTQITRENVRDLKIAWIYHMRPRDVAAAGASFFLPSEATPLVVAGVMYLPTPYGAVVALDADTGRQRWAFYLPDYDRPATRGVAYWPGDGTHGPRIFVGTRSGMLWAVQAADGKPVAAFGSKGAVSLKTPQVMNGNSNGRLGMSSPPFVFRNLVITGSQVQEFPPLGPSGDVRAWDARTGALVWTFHTVPRPGEPGHDTWAGDSWKNRSGVNVWTSPVADSKRGIIYLPIAAPSFDRWGGDRKGKDLFSDSIVAVDAASGRYLWGFQTVHHDLWDSDLPVAALIDVKRKGQTIPAILVANKNAIVFILNRVTGQPIYPVKETPVPTQTDIPGEQPWPTQPIPVAPPPLAQQSFSMSDLDDLTPQIKARCERLVKAWHVAPSRMFEPPQAAVAVAKMPGGEGGLEWGGGTFDSSLGLYIIPVTNMASPDQLARQPDGNWGLAHGYQWFWDTATRIPCQRPPWGQLVAVDVNSGKIAWRRTLGVTDSLPAGLRDTGRPSAGGVTGTAGGVAFVGATDDNRLRAFDISSGKLLWEARLPASIYATPMTYLGKSGTQYVAAVSTGGSVHGPVTNDEVIAFAFSSHERGGVKVSQATDAPAAPTGATPSAAAAQSGLDLIHQRCTMCHNVQQVLEAPHRSRQRWAETVAAMIGRGAQLNPEEAKTVIDYLAKHYGPSGGGDTQGHGQPESHNE